MERKLSVLAAFDDMTRCAATENDGIEAGTVKFLANQDECRKRWLAAEIECERLRRVNTQLEAESRALDTALKHARRAVEIEVQLRKQAEQDKESLDRQISLIRELLSDSSVINDQTRERFAFLNTTCNAHRRSHDSPRRLITINESTGSVLSPSDYSYDKTDEDLDISQPRPHRRSGEGRRSDEYAKRRASAPLAEDMTGKRKKSNTFLEMVTNEPLTATTTVTIPENGAMVATSQITTRSSKRRSSSVPTPETKEVNAVAQHAASEPDSDDSFFRTPRSGSTPGASTGLTPMRQSASKLQNRAHQFVTKTVIKPETCTPCGRKIKFGKPALKCRDCRAVCHPDCRNLVPLPCVPTINTPNHKGVMGTIADYTPITSPMIPGLIVHCINEVESRGLDELGIYRVPGSEREVKDLKEKFLRGKGVPNLTRIDLHVICGCIKDFLRYLKEPIVTYTLWRDFVKAAELLDPQDASSALYQALSDLPQPNRDTLAYIILHLQRVAESPETKMPVSNLAKIFGPTVVGYSCPEPEPSDMLKETKKQAQVMEKLINIPMDYWNRFINPADENTHYNVTETPRVMTRQSSANMAGSARKSRGILTHTPLPPRDDLRMNTTHRRPERFFSPIIK